MKAIVQISDPHFGTERPAVVEALARMIADERPELVILSGDVTQRARRAQFDAARAFVDRLSPSTLIAIPGNHDIPLFNLAARVFSPYAGYRRAFGDDLEPVHRSERWFVAGVRTTRRWRHRNGEVSLAQIERVAKDLESADAAQMRIVVVHQPVAVPVETDVHNLIANHEAAIRRWSAAGADAIIGGHIHLPYVIPLHAKRTDLPRRVWCVQAGTAVSSRIRHEANNSVNVFRHTPASADSPREATVERWDYIDDLDRFVRVAVDALDLDTVDGGR